MQGKLVNLSCLDNPKIVAEMLSINSFVSFRPFTLF